MASALSASSSSRVHHSLSYYPTSTTSTTTATATTNSHIRQSIRQNSSMPINSRHTTHHSSIAHTHNVAPIDTPRYEVSNSLDNQPPRWSNDIRDYELNDVLGKGAFGVVYRAAYKFRSDNGQRQKDIAVKMIDKKLMKRAGMTQRVTNEVEIHWQLDHPSILSLYSYFEDSTNVYLVMELCQQGELYKYIQKRGQPLSENEARGVLKSIVRGLEYLHSHGIIHRDLKLSNLLLTDKMDVKIADFGLAVKLNTPEGEQKTMCGTPNYISPEIISRQPYGLAADMWSLGCLMVTMMTGSPPFESREVKNTLDKVSRVEYSLPEEMSMEAKDLIHRLLQKNPSHRLPLNRILKHPFFHQNRPVQKLSPLNLQNIFHNSVGSSNNKSQHSVTSKVSTSTSVHMQQQRKPLQSSNNSHHQQHVEMVKGVGSLSIGVLKSSTNSNSKENTSAPHPIPPNPLPVPVIPQPQPIPSLPTPAVKATEQASSNTVQPFNIDRLKPLKQRTKHGTLEILIDKTGDRIVVMDLIGEKYIMIITGDGQYVEFYDRNTFAIPEEEFVKSRLSPPLAVFPIEKLSGSMVKKYRYAAKFVELVKSKTPKIVIYSSQAQAKCVLMENAPHPDFTMTFLKDGTKVHVSTSKNVLEIMTPDPSRNVSVNLLSAASIQLPPDLLQVFRDAQQCLRQCMEIEKSGKLVNVKEWPVVLRLNSNSNSNSNSGTTSVRQPVSASTNSLSTSVSSHHQQHDQASFVTNAEPVTRTNLSAYVNDNMSTATLATTTMHGNPLSRSQSSGVMSFSRSRQSSSGKSAHEHSDRKLPQSSSSATLVGGPVTTTTTSTSTTSAHETNSTVAKANSTTNVNTKPYRDATEWRFLDGIGYCYKNLERGIFEMLFTDGCWVLVDGKRQSLSWKWMSSGNMNGNSCGEDLPIDKSLPEPIKAKLATLPAFLKLFNESY